MKSNKLTSYAFLVLTYNHEDLILDHLESIKYLVERYGGEIEVDLIISDDCSNDLTPFIVEKWLSANTYLFRNIKVLFNRKNLGTAICVDNMLKHMVAERCKLTAGDDLYSYENIFELTECGPGTAIVSGIPLLLIGDTLLVDKLANSLAVASQIIYHNNTLLHRFKHFSYNNAPNITYATECLMDSKVRDYLKLYDVTEDWPLQIAIARQFPRHHFNLVKKIFVYYRRTERSSYIVANKRFINDKIQIYDDLISQEKSFIEKIRLICRKKCFESQNRLINKIFNLDFYFFLLSFVINIFAIKSKSQFKINLMAHQSHYNKIHNVAINKMKIIRENR
jgi:hypothetical protein